MKFRDLSIGDTFDFVNPDPAWITMNSFFATCKKTSQRKYTDGRFTYKVGSINAKVFHVNETTGNQTEIR